MSARADLSGVKFNERKIKEGEYFHISFNGKLEGVWKPKLPDGDGVSTGGKFNEPDWPRISVSTTLTGAFRGVYPNIASLFEVKSYPYIEFHVYTPVGESRVVTTRELSAKGYVHDAHITNEVCLLDPIKMKYVGKIRVENTSDDDGLFYYPFNDKTTEKRYHSPKRVRITKL